MWIFRESSAGFMIRGINVNMYIASDTARAARAISFISLELFQNLKLENISHFLIWIGLSCYTVFPTGSGLTAESVAILASKF